MVCEALLSVLLPGTGSKYQDTKNHLVVDSGLCRLVICHLHWHSRLSLPRSWIHRKSLYIKSILFMTRALMELAAICYSPSTVSFEYVTLRLTTALDVLTDAASETSIYPSGAGTNLADDFGQSLDFRPIYSGGFRLTGVKSLCWPASAPSHRSS